MSLGDLYTVKQIKSSIGRDFIKEHHYTHGCHNGPMCWGLFADGGTRLIGVCAFATPSSEAVRASVYGVERKSEVTELHRLVILDETPTNTETWFIKRALRGLHQYKPGYTAVLSFADETEGHKGTIYRASNALYQGRTGVSTFYRDETGRLRHPRQNGVNITKSMALERGWVPERREAKRRYLFLIGGRVNRKRNRKALIKPCFPYDD